MKDTRVRFETRTPFSLDLRRRVDAYLAVEGRDAAARRVMGRKTFVLFAALALGLGLAIVGATTIFVLLGALLAGLALAGLGMNVQHDGGHRAYSKDAATNRRAAAVLDFLGASSYVWHVKHGVAHHTYPNIEGADEDIELRPFARMAPGQPHHWFHRFQHVYLPLLYGFITIKWFWWDDYRDLLRGSIGSTPITRPRGRDLAVFVAGKLVHLLWAVVLPIATLGWGLGLLFYVGMHMVGGMTLALVFQLAHCVEEAEFVQPPREGAGPLVRDFHAHQLATTVDFAPDNALIGWYVGGLNFQAVHHLFPRVCHVHYRALAPIVAQCCAEHGVPYKANPSFLAAVGSHLRWLRRMGRGEQRVRPLDELEPIATPTARAA
jgi:linoleoyl-CoA desaturase